MMSRATNLQFALRTEPQLFDRLSESSGLTQSGFSLHNNKRHVAIDKPSFELRTGLAVLFNHRPLGIGDRKLKHRFGQSNGHSSIHSGLLTLKADPHTQCEPVRLLSRKKAGESIPSLQRIAYDAR